MTQGKNAVGQDRKFWGLIPVAAAPVLLGLAKHMEDIGFEGATALQMYGPPWGNLAVAAAATTTLKIATGVAVASTRSPFETAMIAMDMDRISEGRFILGLGTSIPSVNVGTYGIPDYKPVTHIKDTIAAIHHIISNAHKGLTPYEGAYYKADFKELTLTPPPVRENLPIWIAALRGKLAAAALEVSDGLMVHALWSADYLQEQAPVIAATLAKAGKKRTDVEVQAWPWVAINDNKQQAIDDARPTVAGYCGIKEYEPFFASSGFEKEAALLREGDQRDSLAVKHLVPDEMVEAFVACGSVEQVLERLEPLWPVVDSVCPMAPYRHFTQEQHLFYGAGIHKLVAAAKR
jgi:alkanesulfonate monooxygenase SsuD/methylene tetrahydromethanopterin reductase-like flavin-dependent oxidoreductase (luciferase family)